MAQVRGTTVEKAQGPGNRRTGFFSSSETITGSALKLSVLWFPHLSPGDVTPPA